jgi:hypothetical protein
MQLPLATLFNQISAGGPVVVSIDHCSFYHSLGLYGDHYLDRPELRTSGTFQFGEQVGKADYQFVPFVK